MLASRATRWHRKRKMGAGDVGNSTSPRPLMSHFRPSDPSPTAQSWRAFSSEVDTASREESAQKKKLESDSDSIRTDQGSKKSLFDRLLTIGVTLGSAGQNLLGNQSGVLPDRRFDFRGHFGI